METHRELNLAFAILIAVRAVDLAERWVKAKTVRRHGEGCPGNRAGVGAVIQRIGVAENVGAIHQVKRLSQEFKVISL